MNATSIGATVSFNVHQFSVVDPAMSNSTFVGESKQYADIERQTDANDKHALLMVMFRSCKSVATAYALPVVIGMPAVLSGARYDIADDWRTSGLSLGSIRSASAENKKTCNAVEEGVLETVRTAWRKNLFNRDAGRGAKALIGTTQPLMRSLLQFGPKSIDLTNLDIEKVNGMHLAVILRATAIKKELVPGWYDALQIAKIALRRDGVDADSALAGLKW